MTDVATDLEHATKDVVTAPVEPVKTEAHQILDDAIHEAEDVGHGTLEHATDVTNEAEHQAERITDDALDTLDKAAVLRDVQAALDAHVVEHHTAVVEPEDDTPNGAEAIEITVPPVGELAPEVSGESDTSLPEGDGGGESSGAIAVRRRRVFGRARRR